MRTVLGPHGPEQPLLGHAVPMGVCSPPRGTHSPGQVLLAVAPLPAHSPVERGPVPCCCPHPAKGCWGSRGCPSACTQGKGAPAASPWALTCKGPCWAWAASGLRHAVPVPGRNGFALNDSVPVLVCPHPAVDHSGPALPCPSAALSHCSSTSQRQGGLHGFTLSRARTG